MGNDKTTVIGIGAEYCYNTDYFPKNSENAGECRVSLSVDHTDYGKNAKIGKYLGAKASVGKNFQTIDMYGGVAQRFSNNLTWKNGLYIKAAHTSTDRAKFIDEARLSKMRNNCDPKLVLPYNDTYGGVGLESNLSYDIGKFNINAGAAVEYGEYISLDKKLDCTKANTSSLQEYARAKAFQEGMQITTSPNSFKGNFSVFGNYKANKHISFGTGVNYNTATGFGASANVVYNF